MFIGLRLTPIEHEMLMRVLARENKRRTRPSKSFPYGEEPWTVSDLLREWIVRASRARSYLDGIVS